MAANRTARPVDWERASMVIGLFVTMLALLVGGAVYIVNELAARASTADVEAVKTDVHVLQIDRTRERERDAWRDATLVEIAKRVGAIVPSPPPISP